MGLDKGRLLELYPEYTSVLGPYDRSDGRKHVVLNNSSAPKGSKGKTKTISYPKAIVEANIGRTLLPNETIDHDDRDKTNDDLNNLVIRDRSKHSSLDAVRVKVEMATCPICFTEFEPTVSQRNEQTRTTRVVAGPFCSHKCTGVYRKQIRDGGDKLPKSKVVKIYYKVDK